MSFTVCGRIFCNGRLDEVVNLKYILKWFEICSGLKVNYDKCEMMGIRMDYDSINSLAGVFGYKVGCLPSKYLDLPLCMGLPKGSLWDPVVERVERK